MKKIFKKNQIIITALAVMIAVAGYINYSDSRLSSGEDSKAKAEDAASTSTILEDIESLDLDIGDDTALADTGEETEVQETSETPGEAVLTGASTYMAQAKISREQVRAQNKETLNSIINNTELSEEERQGAVETMVNMTDLVEKEAAAELLLEAKGFTNAVVNLTGETADIVIPQTEIDEASRAQIEDIVKRKTGVSPENIVITPMTQTETEAEADPAADQEDTEQTEDTVQEENME